VLAGDVVLKRSIYRGNVRWTFPHRYVGEWRDRVAIYCGPGNQGKAMRRGPDGYLKRWATDAPPFDTEWEQTHVLRFEAPGARHSVEIYWTLEWEQLSWYVNLQTPTELRNGFIDTTDQALDIVVSPDGEWRWKDEDELAEAVELGIWSEREAEEIRAEGERVIEASPWPTGWEDWRPPEDWRPLGLPRDWHVV
jgi:hypothetical protein